MIPNKPPRTGDHPVTGLLVTCGAIGMIIGLVINVIGPDETARTVGGLAGLSIAFVFFGAAHLINRR